MQCMVRYHPAVSLLGLLKRGQEPAARRICCRFLQRLPDMIEALGQRRARQARGSMWAIPACAAKRARIRLPTSLGSLTICVGW